MLSLKDVIWVWFGLGVVNSIYIILQGAVIGLRIHWDCNLDRSAETCKPEYSARRYPPFQTNHLSVFLHLVLFID